MTNGPRSSRSEGSPGRRLRPAAGFIQGDGRTRAILLDIGDGRVLLLDIEAQRKATYDAALPGAMQIVDSSQFNR